MQKILQISNYMFPHIGGIEQTAKDIADVFSLSSNIEQKIICFNEDAINGEYRCYRKQTVIDKVDDIEVIRCGCFAKIFSQSLSFTYPKQLKKTINEFNPNIVILHYPNPFVTSVLLPLLKKDVKLVVWWHLDIVKQKYLKELFNVQNEKLLKRSNIIVATSPNYINGSKLLNKYRDKCTVISSCIRPEKFNDNQEIDLKVQELKQTYKDKTICFAVGRHVPYKGMEYLVKACEYLDDSYTVIIAGQGLLTDKLMNMSKELRNVKFIGRINNDDLVSYYKACDIFCFPSITKNEAFGLALAEAMYFEKPTVTFTIPGSGVNYVSLNGVTGIECPNKDVRAFAQAIRKLSNDKKLYKEYSINAKERVQNNFLFNRFREKVIENIVG